jgi:hypothetical protein
MPLLAEDNTDFETSVTRWAPHYKTRSLKDLVAALNKAGYSGKVE